MAFFRTPATIYPPALQSTREVQVYWGGELQSLHHLTPPRPFVVSPEPGADLCMSQAQLDGQPAQHLNAPGAYDFGDLCIVVLPDQDCESTRFPKISVDHKALPAWLASIALHGLLLLLFALMPPASSALSIADLQRDGRYCAIESMPKQAPDWIEPAPDAAAQDGDSQASPGEPARQATSPKSGRNPRRNYAPTAQRPGNEPQTDIRDVLRSAGMMLEQSSSEYTAARAQATGPSALGALLGSVDGNPFSLGGLTMQGTGQSRAGNANGTIGATVGTRGRCIGAACDGYGTSAGGLSTRTGRVPQRLRVGTPEVVGSLSKEVIRRGIRRQLARVRHCYEQRLGARPDLQGRLAVRFLIDANGPVRAAAVESSTLQDSVVETCIVNVMRKLSFPAPGGIVKVTYPFTFSRL